MAHEAALLVSSSSHQTDDRFRFFHCGEKIDIARCGVNRVSTEDGKGIHGATIQEVNNTRLRITWVVVGTNRIWEITDYAVAAV